MWFAIGHGIVGVVSAFALIAGAIADEVRP